jgi:hypothetical protein
VLNYVDTRKIGQNAMAFIEVPNTCAVELRFTQNSIALENTLYFYISTGVTEANMLTLATLCAEWWYTGPGMRLWQSNTVVHKEVYARDLTSEDGPVVTYTGRTGVTGSSSATVVPSNVAFSILFHTAKRGRSYRGRNFTFGLATTFLSGSGYVTSSYRNGVLAAYALLLPSGAKDPTPYRWVVASRYHDREPRTTGVAEPIASVACPNDKVKDMGRRLP